MNGALSIISIDKELSFCIRSTMEALDVPHIQVHLDDEKEKKSKEFVLNVFPLQSTINSAFIDVMLFLNWTRCAVIYDKDEGEINSIS